MNADQTIVLFGSVFSHGGMVVWYCVKWQAGGSVRKGWKFPACTSVLDMTSWIMEILEKKLNNNLEFKCMMLTYMYMIV